MVPSSSGLGRGPLKAATRVQIPLGSPIPALSKNTKVLFLYTGFEPYGFFNSDYAVASLHSVCSQQQVSLRLLIKSALQHFFLRPSVGITNKHPSWVFFYDPRDLILQFRLRRCFASHRSFVILGIYWNL